MLPNFLGIGTQRSGSTWLYQVLNHHPQIFLSKTKEIHYFDWKMLQHDLGWYKNHFADAKDCPEKHLVGEITPSYCTIPSEFIRSLNILLPGIPLFIVLRNPVERAWSGALYELGVMHNIRLESVPTARVLRHLVKPRNYKRTNYCEMIQNWRSAYSSENLHISLFDEFQRDPYAHLHGILKHLGPLCQRS